jgi:1-acyl-sn-glycerol-3-phosphate acyltransferase
VKVLLSAFFWVYLALSLMVFWFAVVPVWLLLSPFDRRRRFSHWYAWTWANHYVALSPFWRIEVEHGERIAADGTYVLVANHQSIGDIFVLYQLRRHFKWVAKRSVFLVPFLGWMMWMADYVPIRRGDQRSRDRMLQACLAHLRRGSSILMFPEGTRSRDGALHEFRRGAFSVAIAAGVPVLPIVIDGTLHALPQGSWVFQQEGRLSIRVRVLEPVAPERFAGDALALQAYVQAQMAGALAELRETAAARAATGASSSARSSASDDAVGRA